MARRASHWALVLSAGSTPRTRRSRSRTRQSAPGRPWEALHRFPWPRARPPGSRRQRGPRALWWARPVGPLLPPRRSRPRACASLWQICSGGTWARADTIFANSSVASLNFHAMWLSSIPSNLSSRRRTNLQYASILGSWQFDSFMTWSMTSCESSRMSRRRTPSSMAIYKPLTRASYSAALLEAAKWSRIM